MERPLRFQQLPNELLHAVATRCDAISAVRLSATCQSVRNACYTAQTFKEIIQAVARREGDRLFCSCATPSPLQLHNLLECFNGDAGIAARYAIALTKAAGLERDRTQDGVLHQLERYIAFMPHLRLFGYVPSSPNCTAVSLLKDFVREVRKRRNPTGSLVGTFRGRETALDQLQCTAVGITRQELMMRLTFCIAVEILNGECNGQERSRLSLPFAKEERISTRELLMLLGQDRSQLDICGWGPTTAQLTVATIAHSLHQLSREPHPFYRPTVMCPSAAQFGLIGEKIDHRPPVPLNRATNALAVTVDSIGASVAELSWEEWLRQRARQVLPDESKETWQGYYCSNFNDSMEDERQAMEDVSIWIAENPVASTPGIREIHGEGHDEDGAFTIEGSLSYITCKFWAEFEHNSELYPSGHRWTWRGVLTPFGLVGSRHETTENDWRVGYVWLWRKERQT